MNDFEVEPGGEATVPAETQQAEIDVAATDDTGAEDLV